MGVTHECNHKLGRLPQDCQILTLDGIGSETKTQGEIHEQVQQKTKQHLEHAAASRASLLLSKEEVPSLYPILRDPWMKARPNLVITQDLCHVCAPSSAAVQCLIQEMGKHESREARLLSLSPQSLPEVAETFVMVAQACHVPERGIQLRDEFLHNLQTLQSTLKEHMTGDTKAPNTLILEWLDPLFDAGHWMWDMMDYALTKRTELAPSSGASIDNSRKRKSKQVSWSDVQRADPDVVLVAGCGFNLQRNLDDARRSSKFLTTLRATQQGRLYCVDADQYFVRPGPSLLLGTVVVALCVHQANASLVSAVHNLPFVPKDLKGRLYANLDLVQDDQNSGEEAVAPMVPDAEDFHTLHEQACQRMEESYIDPSTGYSVFTEVAHRKRGKCCGSGCRHCPYGHENLKDKSRIKQPSILVRGTLELLHTKHGNLRILFFSGGKDSFLTIRALVRQAQDIAKKEPKQLPFGLVLLTTFDATSRIIAHQDVSIDTVMRQATHLGLSLIGVPMHRGSSEGYVSRIRRAFETIERQMGSGSGPTKIESLVFGDLHLEHVLSWRKEQLGPLRYRLEFPLLHVNYETLKEDFKLSQVHCVVSSSTVSPRVQVGEIYDQKLMERLEQLNKASTDDENKESSSIDVFGECGEFHTVVQVWETERSVVLGLH